jgi:hypothetical protein
MIPYSAVWEAAFTIAAQPILSPAVHQINDFDRRS